MADRRMDSCKLLWHLDRLKDYLDGKRVAPVHIDCGIAKFCNIKCTWCYGYFQNPSKAYIEREALIGLVTDAKKIGVRSLAFIGDGEPTMNPYMYEALCVAETLGLDMALSTNGVLVDTEDKCRVILKACRWMRYCIGSGTRDGYKKVHGVDRFDRVESNIALMLETRRKLGLKCDVGLQTVFIPGLMNDDVVSEAKMAIDLGVDYFVVKQCSLPDEGQSGMYQFKMEDYDRPEVISALEEAEDMSTDKTKIIVKWNVIGLKGRKAYSGCPSIPLLSEISGNGDWYPCGYMFGDKPEFAEYKFGNIHEEGLKKIWESERYWDIIKKMASYPVGEKCKGCCRQDPNNIAWDGLMKECDAWATDGGHSKNFWTAKREEVAQMPVPMGRNFI